ncbi:HpcH/HpaI aldolase/citrate lyase family protein [Paracoccus mangrovi]|uniref:HpcH/HpaI aldolase/citrate lyase family protein n=1 Tax=Paracoccus mangrovi TaxID=1715645 RepID=A0ABV7RA93_9RHOB
MNPLKQRLRAGETLKAAWVGLASPDVAEIMVRHGWDIIVIDGEHGIGTLEDWVATARAAEAAGGQVILRVPDGSDSLLKRVLDRGFRSIIVPMVNSADEAAAIVGACRYPGQGRRGYAAPVVRGSRYGVTPGYGTGAATDELLLILQCEHIAAVDQVQAMVGVDGVDMLFIGPNDLAGSMGLLEQLTAPPVQEAIARVETAAKAGGRWLGTITGPGRDWADLDRLGYRLVVGPSDIALMIAGARAAARTRDGA